MSIETKHTVFIQKYNEIESLIKKIKNFPSDANIKYLEDNIEDSEIKNKLYICRITRNYIQHNTDYKNFINISDEQLKFLDYLKEFVTSKIETTAEFATPLNKFFTLKTSDKIQENFDTIYKKKKTLIPIFNKDNILFGVLNISDIALNIIQGIKKTDKFENIDTKKYNKNKNTFKFIKKDLLYEEALNIFKDNENVKLIFVTDNGKSTEKILGIIERENFF